MIKAKTYLHVDRELIALERFEGTVRDPDYVEGAIDLQIDTQPFITTDCWDLVDQLWAYLVNAAVAISQGTSFETRFPDQPLRMTFTLDAEMVLMELHRRREPRAALLPRRDFVDGISAAAAPVFARLVELIPQNREGYQRVLQQIERLRSTAKDDP